MLPDQQKLKEIFSKILGTERVFVTIYGDGHITVRALEVEWLDDEILSDIEANGFFIEKWFFDIAAAGTLVVHLVPEEVSGE